jgi:hypothetical protein
MDCRIFEIFRKLITISLNRGLYSADAKAGRQRWWFLNHRSLLMSYSAIRSMVLFKKKYFFRESEWHDSKNKVHLKLTKWQHNKQKLLIMSVYVWPRKRIYSFDQMIGIHKPTRASYWFLSSNKEILHFRPQYLLSLGTLHESDSTLIYPPQYKPDKSFQQVGKQCCDISHAIFWTWKRQGRDLREAIFYPKQKPGGRHS